MRQGLSPEHARRRAGYREPVDPMEEVVVRLVNQGLLTQDMDRYRLTEKGRPLADAIASEFFSVCE